MAKEKETYTKYEKARIIGARALQISANAPILLKLSKEELEKIGYDPIKIAELEFKEGVLPITVKRPMPKKIEQALIQEEVEIVKEEEEATESEEALPEEKEKVEEAEEIEQAAEEAEETEEVEESEEIEE
ncbi:MAG TPA: DNA-directed RNA polymerase subunit K [Candidatus Pacearchaeota archaeon]|nr:MAG: hypothetical protein B6U82_01445 [Candidatus Pacearchaeota archaeon ex4484_31]HDI03007.1 DNA-directed RNA polymerase subunit K [Candidatus Pacearchaeota archaeon]